VENFIFNGADLMWPGIAYADNENNFKQNQIAVIYARNKLVEAQIVAR